MKPEQAELARLRREGIKLKAERDILKKAAVGSGDSISSFRSQSLIEELETGEEPKKLIGQNSSATV